MGDQLFKRSNPLIGPLARLRKTPCALLFAGLVMTLSAKDWWLLLHALSVPTKNGFRAILKIRANI